VRVKPGLNSGHLAAVEFEGAEREGLGFERGRW